MCIPLPLAGRRSVTNIWVVEVKLLVLQANTYLSFFVTDMILFNRHIAAWALALSCAATSVSALAKTPEQVIADMGIQLQDKPAPKSNFAYAVKAGNLLFVSGHIPISAEGKVITGKVGKDLDLQQARAAAKTVGVSILATLKQQLGDLSRVKQIVKVTGMVNATPDFTQHSQVMNAFSDLMTDVFGAKGKHARAAVGMGSLPVNAAIEIEAVVELYN